MTKYLYLFRGGDNALKDKSPEEMQQHMALWQTWMKRLAEKGILEDGLPLGAEGKVVSDSGNVITDGPFAEGPEIVGGYLIVKANSLDEATETSKGCPIFQANGTVEVREILNM